MKYLEYARKLVSPTCHHRALEFARLTRFEGNGETMGREQKRRLSQYMRESARDAMKAGMVINGAAAIALLAFVGNIWSEAKDIEAVGPIADSILYFCLGVAMSGFAFAAHYAVLENDTLINITPNNRFQRIFNQFILWIWTFAAIFPFILFFISVLKFHEAIYERFA